MVNNSTKVSAPMDKRKLQTENILLIMIDYFHGPAEIATQQVRQVKQNIGKELHKRKT